MRRFTLNLFASIVALCILLVTTASFAQPAAPAAEALFEQGRKAMDAQDYDTACARFQESERLDPTVNTEYNLGTCEEKRGKIATAWELYNAVAQRLPPEDERRPIAQEKATALEKRLPRLTLKLAAGAPSGTTVKLGKTEMGPGSFGIPLPLDPGSYEVLATAPGHSPRSFPITLTEAQQQEIEVAPGPKATDAAWGMPGPHAPPGPSAAPLPPVNEPEPAEKPSFGKRHTASLVVGGTAIALGIVGFALGGSTWASYKDLAESCGGTVTGCDQSDIDSVTSKRTATNVLLALAGATLAATIVIFAVEASSSDIEAEPATEPRGALAAGPGGASLLLRY